MGTPMEAPNSERSAAVSGKLKWLFPKATLVSVLVAIGIIGAIGYFGFLAIYFFQFHGNLSSSAADWGLFGDFIGGATNPFLSFLSFIAILITVAIQWHELQNSNKILEKTREELRQSHMIAKQQVDHFKNEAKRNQLQFMIKSTGETIEKVFERKLFTPKLDIDVGGMTMADIFSRSFSHGMEDFIPKNGTGYLAREDVASIKDLVHIIIELNSLFQEYKPKFGSDAFLFFYKKRYLRCATQLNKKGYLSEGMISEFMNASYGYSMNEKSEEEELLV
jgi:hypothetical protein